MENDKLVRLSHAISAAKTGADDWDGGCNIERDRYIEKAFADIPAVDAVEVRQARWVEKQHKMIGNTPCCSLCGWFVVIETSYCPGCGAKMDGGKHGTD